ncbi:MAG: DUF6275 family protein [Synergistaceae bacterium]
MKKFIDFCKEQVLQRDEKTTDIDNVFVVWSCKTLQNKKALLSSTDKGAKYFELTYNGDKNECYVDEYQKVKNSVVRMAD